MDKLFSTEVSYFDLFRKIFPFLFSLLDDFLIIGLSRLGCNIPWLEWLSPIMMTGTLIYLLIQFWQSPYGAQKFMQIWQEFEQRNQVVET